MMSAPNAGPGGSRRLAGVFLLAGAFGLLVLAAPAVLGQEGSSETDGSETEGQQVSVSHGGESGGSSGGGDASGGGQGAPTCGSSVTVVTDEGTSHPSGGSSACATAPPAPLASSSPASVASSAQSSPLAESTPTASPSAVQASPIVTVATPAPVAVVVEPQRKGSGLPALPIAVAGVLLAGGYLATRRLRRGTPTAVREPEMRSGWFRDDDVSEADLLFLDEPFVPARSQKLEPERLAPVPNEALPTKPPPPTDEIPLFSPPAPDLSPSPTIPVRRYAAIAPELLAKAGDQQD